MSKENVVNKLIEIMSDEVRLKIKIAYYEEMKTLSIDPKSPMYIAGVDNFYHRLKVIFDIVDD